MDPDIWDVFHDGDIVQIVGDVPGVVELHLEIRYLRAMFSSSGIHFRIRLVGCSKIEYREYDQPATSDLAAIASKEPEVLSLISAEPLRLCCAEGELELAYAFMEVFLDSGEPVTYEELSSASERYWDSWSNKR